MSRKPKTSTLPNRATAETIPRFQMRTKDGVWITVACITAHVEMVEQRMRRREAVSTSLDLNPAPAAARAKGALEPC